MLFLDHLLDPGARRLGQLEVLSYRKGHSWFVPAGTRREAGGRSGIEHQQGLYLRFGQNITHCGGFGGDRVHRGIIVLESQAMDKKHVTWLPWLGSFC